MQFIRLDVDFDRFKEFKERLGDKDTNFFGRDSIIGDSYLWVPAYRKEAIKKQLGEIVLGEQAPQVERGKFSYVGNNPDIIFHFIDIVAELTNVVGFSKVTIIDHEEPAEAIDQGLIIRLDNKGIADRYDDHTNITINQVRFNDRIFEAAAVIQIPINDGIPFIKDDDEDFRVYYEGNTIWLPPKIDLFGENTAPVIRESIARVFARQLIDKCQDNNERGDTNLEAAREEFIKFSSRYLDEKREGIEREIVTLTSSIEEKERRLASLYCELTQKGALLKALTNTEVDTKYYNDQFDEIKKYIPLLTYISIEDNSKLVFETKTIYLEGDSAKNRVEFDRFPLGRYRVVLESGEIPFITNLTRRLTYEYCGATYSWDHPHVKEHTPCLGNITAKVNKLIANGEWFAAIQYIIAALQSFNSEDGWSPVGLPHWQQAAKNALGQNFKNIEDKIKSWIIYEPKVVNSPVQTEDEVTLICPPDCPVDCGHRITQPRKVKVLAVAYPRLYCAWEEDGNVINCPGLNVNHIKKEPEEDILLDVKVNEKVETGVNFLAWDKLYDQNDDLFGEFDDT